jgi:hypothetical protein
MLGLCTVLAGIGCDDGDLSGTGSTATGPDAGGATADSASDSSASTGDIDTSTASVASSVDGSGSTSGDPGSDGEPSTSETSTDTTATTADEASTSDDSASHDSASDDSVSDDSVSDDSASDDTTVADDVGIDPADDSPDDMGAGGAPGTDDATDVDAGGPGEETGDEMEPEPIEIDPDAVFAAPDGAMGASGTIDDPMTITAAIGRVNAGETVYLRGGTYPLNMTINLDGSGGRDSPITLSGYPLDDERPLLDFSAMAEASSNRGLILSGSYWYVFGIDVFHAGDNCMFVGGSNNTIEFSTFSECADTGLQLGNGAADNLIVNCDSYFNADRTLENADGFAAKLDVGTGNRFVGCRAWNNLDDGWDGYLRPADGVTTTYEDCWAIDNGKLKNGSVGAGDGNGFKTGGSDTKNLRHNAVYERCISAGNVNDGFDHNSNRGSVTILNCAAHDNGSNINFGMTNIAGSLTIKNTISVGVNGMLLATTTDITNNSWQDGLSASADDFVSLDTSLLKAPRQSDGSLPDIDYLKLVPDSDLRNAGVDVGLPYEGSAPDLGPFESAE